MISSSFITDLRFTSSQFEWIFIGFYNWWIFKDGYTLENAVIVVRHGDRTSMSVTDGETKSICDLSTYVKPFLESYKSCIHPKGKKPNGQNILWWIPGIHWS